MQDQVDLEKAGGSREVTEDETGVTYYKGRAYWPYFSWKTAKYAVNEWEIPANTVIISSYVKTGTVWCAEIARQLLSRGNDEILDNVKSMQMSTFLLESHEMEKFELYPNQPIKLVWTHIPVDLFNFDRLRKSKVKIIYMYRNPKDQIVSWYHFVNKLKPFNKEQHDAIMGKDWNDFFAKYTAGEQPTGMAKGEWYLDHLKAWMNQAKVTDNILPVEYESLKKDFSTELRRIAGFLGVDITDDDVTRISGRCTVDAMRSSAGSSGFLKANIRKGGVGGWKDQFTVSQSEHIDRLVEEKLAGTGIKFTYQL